MDVLSESQSFIVLEDQVIKTKIVKTSIHEKALVLMISFFLCTF